MKIWNGYGTEHSMNLVMIGYFQTLEEARKAKDLIERLSHHVDIDVNEGQIKVGKVNRAFSEQMLKFLMQTNMSIFSPQELEQFRYDVKINVHENQLRITTDEIDVSVFIKLMVSSGARVEVYSAHHHPDTGLGRRTGGS